MKIIYINGKFTRQRLTGVQRFAHEMVLALDRVLTSRANSPRVVLLTPTAAPKLDLKWIEQCEISSFGKSLHFWEQIALPWAARSGLLLNLTGAAPLLHPQQTIHIPDAAVFDHPEAYSQTYAYWYRFLFGNLKKRARLILTLSSFSRQRIAHHLGDSPNYCVVSCAVSHVNHLTADENVIERLRLLGRPYLLAVGSANPTKNFDRLIKAFNKLSDSRDVRLVLAGGSNAAVFANYFTEGSNDRIVRAGAVTDAELKALYQHALAFVFPSTYEGFGIPPLEAMSCGCPVIASSAASIPEVCSDAARYFDPYDVDSIRDAMREIIDDTKLREELTLKGNARSTHFSWEASAKQFLNQLSLQSADAAFLEK